MQMNTGTSVVVPVLSQLAKIQTVVELEQKQHAHKFVKLDANVWLVTSAREVLASKLLSVKLVAQQMKNF